MNRPSTTNLLGLVALAALVWFGSTSLASFAARGNTLPNNDEIYHLLAAESYVADGEFTVGTGTYRRAGIFTQYVATHFGVFGTSLPVAKTSIALVYGLFIVAIFLSLRTRIGPVPAALSAAFFAISPLGLEYATTVRFYVPQATLFWVGAFCVYRSVVERRQVVASLIVALLAWLLAFVLQPVTAVGAVAVVGWAALYLAFENRKWLARGVSRMSTLQIAAAVLGLLIVAVGVWQSGLVGAALAKYQTQALWNQGSRIQYYYWVLTENFNPFWAVYPLACVLALRRNVPITVFSAIVFVVSFVLLSFAGMKEDRYLLFALPFFFVPLAIAMFEVYVLLGRQIPQILEQAGLRSGALVRASTSLVVAGALAFFFISNLGYIDAAKDIVRGQAKREQPRWDLLAAEHGGAINDEAVLITNSPNYALYYLDRLAVAMGASRLQDGSETGAEFSRDRRTGVALISSVDSLNTVLDCSDSVYVVAEDRQWKKNENTGFPTGVAQVVESRMTQLETPKSWQLRLFEWKRPADDLLTDEVSGRANCSDHVVEQIARTTQPLP
ncbi:MAG: hypothetical protein AAFZ58_01540 [Pseudomonadota bacterium]